jgi:hypothetical protein
MEGCQAEVAGYFNLVVEHILRKDKKRLIHMWNTSTGGKYASNLPLYYTPRLPSSVLDLCVTRSSSDSTQLELANDDSDLSITHDHHHILQEKDLTTIGFLVGSSPNLKDVTEAHANHPILKGLKIIALEQSITKLASGRYLILPPW